MAKTREEIRVRGRQYYVIHRQERLDYMRKYWRNHSQQTAHICVTCNKQMMSKRFAEMHSELRKHVIQHLPKRDIARILAENKTRRGNDGGVSV